MKTNEVVFWFFFLQKLTILFSPARETTA